MQSRNAVINFITNKGNFDGVEIECSSYEEAINYILDNKKILDIYKVTEFFFED